MNPEGKIIVIDWLAIVFNAIFSHKYTPQIPLKYSITNMVLANILKIGLEPQDTVMIAVDKGKSWRKMYDENYKADRKEKREAHKEINWEDTWKQVNELLLQLEYATDWYWLYSEGLEADDWASYIPRYYKDKECILLSFDSDWEQMLALPNVKLFSPKSKKYKFNSNPYATLAKKINKETSDNLTNPILNEKDFEKRAICVSLFKLPEFVETIIKDRLDTLSEIKEEYIVDFPFKSLQLKYASLYNDKTKTISIEKCAKAIERKKKGKKKCSSKKQVKQESPLVTQ